MAIRSIQNLDVFSKWIIKIENRNGKLVGHFFPNVIVETLTFSRLMEELMQHVMSETVFLCCECFDIDVSDLRRKSRKNGLPEVKTVTAIILHSRYRGKIRVMAMAAACGYTNHSSLTAAVKKRTAPNIHQKIQRVYKRYPFLKDNKTPLQ